MRTIEVLTKNKSHRDVALTFPTRIPLMTAAGTTTGAPIRITHHSFEGAAVGDGGFIATLNPDWDSIGGSIGVENIPEAAFVATTEPSDGTHIGLPWEATISQIPAATLTAGAKCTLRAEALHSFFPSGGPPMSLVTGCRPVPIKFGRSI